MSRCNTPAILQPFPPESVAVISGILKKGYLVAGIKNDVMSAEKANRTKLLQIRLTVLEVETLRIKFSHSTCKKLTDYARKMLFGKPIAMYHRNQSLDNFMAEMIALRTELNAIGNNSNQAVKRLHSLQHFEEIKTWLLLNEIDQANSTQ